MTRKSLRIVPLGTTVLALACLAGPSGCGDSDEGALSLDQAEEDKLEFKEPTEDQLQPKSVPLDVLPKVDAIKASEVFVQRLPEVTKSGENVALHVKLPPPANKELEESLIRIVGEGDNPLILFRTDALVELGHIKHSPGKEFFTAFVQLDEKQLELRKELEQKLGKAEKATADRIVFNGRTPVAISTGVAFDFDIFDSGDPVPLGACPIQPVSDIDRWGESLLITDTQVVQDTTRTNDVCRPGADNPDGVWTFKHLMEEMATGSGLSTHDFVRRWLENWLTNDVVNGDTILRRTQMFNLVIRPWANASGITSSLSASGVLTLGGQLDLNKAPFRLSAIVNRIDLGATETGPGGYGGGITSRPTTAGELRFVFGVQNSQNCQVLPFSVIFEYGVPIEGCNAVKQWALDWVSLNDPSFAAPFSAAWRDHLEVLTESVVLHGAAPARGNQNAINQIRTNENGLNIQWEFREFTLSTEDPNTGVDTPLSGPLQPHTVAMTPDDTVYDDFSDPMIDDFALFSPVGGLPGVVLSSVPSAVGTTPGALGPVLTNCSASYQVPHLFNGAEFRGGNSFTSAPNRWRVNAASSGDLREVCAREQFSVNTCNGCHLGDTATSFFHVDPRQMPAGLSDFLTGGSSGIWEVPDQQFGSSVAVMQFRDLDNRFNRLYEIACTQCGRLVGTGIDILPALVEFNGFVPIDELGFEKPKFPIGPVKDIKVVDKVFSLRDSFAKTDVVQDVDLGKLVRPRQTFVE